MHISTSMGRYALGYFLVGFVLVWAVGLYMWLQSQTISQDFQIRSLGVAHSELAEAGQQLLQISGMLAGRLAGWDETVQQLQNPTYYAYWRENRVMQAMDIPKNVLAIELYNSAGKSLSSVRNIQSNHNFPDKLDAIGLIGSGRDVVVSEQGQLFLYKYYPVMPRSTMRRSGLLGLVAIKLDLIPEIKALLHARYLDGESLQIHLASSQVVSLDEALSLAEFGTRPIPEIVQLKDIISKVLLQYSIVGLLTLGLVYLFLGRQVARPLKQIVAHINALEAGEKNPLALRSFARVFRIEELDAVATAINDYQNRLEALHMDMEYQRHQLEEMAHTDALTEAANRRGLDVFWSEMKSNRRYANHSVAMVLFDCDHFKAINDTYGHDIGDKVLIGIVEAINRLIRADNRPFRLGGDEFALILMDVDQAAAEGVATRALRAIEEYCAEHIPIGEPVKVSVGIAMEAQFRNSQLETLKAHADIAMYQAKRPASNKISVYNETMQQSGMMLSNRVAHLVQEAIKSGQHIEMHYQKIQGFSQEIDYYEALVRLRDPSGKLIPPADIFPYIELKSLEVEFDRAIITAITEELKQGIVPENVGLSINLSPPGMNNDEVMVALQKLKATCNGSRKIVIEVTENTLIADLDAASIRIEKLHKLDFLVALDDFGSGYSSLAYLTSMPVDIVKFDISMIKSSRAKGEFSTIVATLSVLLVEAGYILVAEGVENKTLFKQVQQAGFQYAQGYFIDRPSLFSAKSEGKNTQG